MLHVHAAYSDRFVDLVGEGFDAGVRVGYDAPTPSPLLVRRSKEAPGSGRPAVAVGTCVSSHAPRPDPYVRLSRIRLLPRVQTANSCRMCSGAVIREPGADSSACFVGPHFPLVPRPSLHRLRCGCLLRGLLRQRLAYGAAHVAFERMKTLGPCDV